MNKIIKNELRNDSHKKGIPHDNYQSAYLLLGAVIIMLINSIIREEVFLDNAIILMINAGIFTILKIIHIFFAALH